MIIIIIDYAVHLHSENKEAALSRSLRLYRNRPATLIDDLLDNCETKADAIAILWSCASKFTKEWEQLAEIFFFDTHTRVFNMNNKGAYIAIVVYFNLDIALRSELNRIL